MNNSMIEMFSKEECGFFAICFFGLIGAVLFIILCAETIPIIADQVRYKLKKRRQEKGNAELIVHITDQEYYELVMKALNEQMVEVRCYIDGIDEIIKIMKGE